MNTVAPIITDTRSRSMTATASSGRQAGKMTDRAPRNAGNSSPAISPPMCETGVPAATTEVSSSSATVVMLRNWASSARDDRYAPLGADVVPDV